MIYFLKLFFFCKKCFSLEVFDLYKINVLDEGFLLKRKNNELIILKGNVFLVIILFLLILLVLIFIEFIDRIFVICFFLFE